MTHDVTVTGQPLQGHRVIDLTMNMSGPWATMLLADMGADVIKVEPPDGDPIRQVGSGSPGMSAYFANLNRNKRSIVVDLQTGEGMKIVHDLVRDADVLMHNFRPGVAERLGVGADELRSLNPRLVYLAISGFGTDGPLHENPAYDHVIQALSGMAAVQADSTGRPELVHHGVVDKTTGYAAAQAVTAALLERHRTGTGAAIEVSMLEVAIGFLWPDGMMDKTIEHPERSLPAISRTFRLTRTADGFLSVITLTDRQWSGLRAAVGLDDEAAGSVQDRMRTGAETMREVVRRIAEMSTDEAISKLAANGVPCAPVLGLDDVPAHPQVVASGVLHSLEHPVLGRITQPRLAPRWNGAVDRLEPSPVLGQHTDDVLTERGMSAERVAELRRAGVVA